MQRKRIFCVVTVFVLISAFFKGNCMSVYAEENDYDEKVIIEIMEEERESYVHNPEFYREAECKGLSFEELLRQKAVDVYQTRIYLEEHKKISTYGIGNNGQNIWANVPLIQQPDPYTCGPTSALQALYGMFKQNNVEGSTDKEKIEKLAKVSGTDKSGTIVSNLVSAMNLYSGLTRYAYKEGLEMTETQFQGKVEGSLLYDIPPIVHARTEYMSYYNGHRSGHYIVIREVDKTNKTMRLMDCNYNNAYYGDHVVPVSEVYQSISMVSDRYLISVSN